MFSNMNATVSQKVLNRPVTDFTKMNNFFTVGEFVNGLLSTVGRVLGSGNLRSKV